MARSQNSFIKNQKANKKKKKREQKLQRKIDKKEQETSGSLNDMMAYIDEHGNIMDEPPEKKVENKSKDKNENERNRNS